jgi:hypothetical protein
MTSNGSESDHIKLTVSKRLQAEGRWPEAVSQRNQLMKEARGSGMSKAEAQTWTYQMLNEMYPPIQTNANESGAVELETEMGGGEFQSDRATVEDSETITRAPDSAAGVAGLDRLPASWPTLPANAALASEIQWVQANRLSVTRLADGVAVVDLSKAMNPAPSWSALGWLETSIRAYAKFVDVAAKVSATTEDDREAIKRERIAIEEIRGLLAEMLG